MQQEVQSTASAFEKDWRDATSGLGGSVGSDPVADAFNDPVAPLAPPPPEYRHPKKNWRLKRGATPQWYKKRNGVRTHAQSGAARVARFRPPSYKR